MLRFSARLQAARGGGHAVALTAAQVEALHGKPHARVKGTVNGAPLRTSMFPYGGTYYLMIHKATVQAADAAPGAMVALAVEPDTAPRRLAIPPDLARALRDAGLAAPFAALSFTRRKELARAVAEAKRPATRERRIQAALRAARGPPSRPPAVLTRALDAQGKANFRALPPSHQRRYISYVTEPANRRRAPSARRRPRSTSRAATGPGGDDTCATSCTK
jgi:hypothetical protein